MSYAVILKILATILVTYFKTSLYESLYEIQDYGRIAFDQPPPPTQVYFPTSADYAEYYPPPIPNVIVTIPSPLPLSDPISFENPASTDASFFPDSSLPRLFLSVLHKVAQIAAWTLSAAGETVVVVLELLMAVGPPATVAYVVREQRIRELQLTVVGQAQGIKQREDELRAQQEDSSEKFATYEAQIAELEQSLQAQQKTCGHLEAELSTARGHITGLLSALQSSSYELQTYRDWARAQQPANHPSPTPTPSQPQPMMRFPLSAPAVALQAPLQPTGMQFSPGQSPFAPQPPQSGGFPPNRSSGFTGNTPPSRWGRGAGSDGEV